MINPRKITTLGIGFGPAAIAAIGLLADLPVYPPVEGDCGPICCSIIVGKFQLGCQPITAKFDLSCVCTPPIPPGPTPGGGGGGWASYVVHTPYKQTFRTLCPVTITVKLEDIKWKTFYSRECERPPIHVEVHNFENRARTANVEITNLNLKSRDVTVDVSRITHNSKVVTVKMV